MPFKYRLRGCINFTRLSKPGQTEIIAPIVNRLLRIDATIIPTGKKILIGKINPICQGMPNSISYKVYSGSELFLLPDIGTYSIRFISSGALQYGAVRFFEKIGRLSDIELREVQSLLGMVAEMVSGDTRNLIAALETTSATISADKAAQDATNAANLAAIAAAQLAADTANSGVAAVQTVTTEISEQMVINETFTLSQTAFTFQSSGLYHAVMDLMQIDGAKGVQLSLTDSDGDDQGFSQLISPYLGDPQKATVELTANQLASISYPLSFLCQGRKLAATGGTPPSQPIVTSFKQLGSRANYYQLVNGTVDHSIDGVTVTDSMVMLNVTSAHMLTGNGRVYFSLNDGTYFYMDGTQPLSVPVEITQSIFASTVGFPDRVAL